MQPLTILVLFLVVSLFLLSYLVPFKIFTIRDVPVLSGTSALKKSPNTSLLKPYAQVAISLAVLTVALYIILSQQYDAKDKHWAYGAVGTVMGFWLKG
jgi:Na+/melibiose symporter-like transporter